MRLSLMVASAAVLLVGTSATASASTSSNNAPYTVAAVTAPVTASLAIAQDPQPPAKGEVNVKVDLDNGGPWYGNPMWIVLGVVALVVVVLLVALAGRGGSDTTVVS